MPYSENVKILNFTSFANKQLYFIRKNLIFFWNKTIERYLVLTMGLVFFIKKQQHAGRNTIMLLNTIKIS